MKSIQLKNTGRYITVFLATLLMCSAVFIYVAPHVGWSVDAIISGSMEPALSVGSLVVTRPIDPEDIRVGDIITFSPIEINDIKITHRVIGIEKSLTTRFFTKGDANPKHDPFKVTPSNLVGKICLIIPFLGNFTQFLKTPIGFASSIILPSIIVLTIYIFALGRALRSMKKSAQLEDLKW